VCNIKGEAPDDSVVRRSLFYREILIGPSRTHLKKYFSIFASNLMMEGCRSKAGMAGSAWQGILHTRFFLVFSLSSARSVPVLLSSKMLHSSISGTDIHPAELGEKPRTTKAKMAR